jgi:hypothetical protein
MSATPALWHFGDAVDDEPEVQVGAAEVRALRRALRGRVVVRGDDAYDAVVAPKNLEVTWRPQLVVTCLGVADVVAAVRFASERGIRIAVRGGGTGTAGAPDDALLIDLSELRGIAVDPEARLATAQPGVTWNELTHETSHFGLAAPGSQMSGVGVAGYALGGGHSWLARRLGWGSDDLESVELVTPGGDRVVASADQDPELFWGLRGAGWNFGVVTALTFRLHPIDTVVAGFVWYRADRIGALMRVHREWSDTMPDELTTTVDVLRTPPGLPVADDARGAVLARIGLCWSGEAGAARAALSPLADVGEPLLDSIAPMRYRTLQAMAARGLPLGVHMRWRMHYLDTLPDAVVAATSEHTRDMAPATIMSIHHYGGALGRVGEDESAMSHRDQPYNYMVLARWTGLEDGQLVKGWQDDFLGAVAPHASGRHYVNYLFDEPEKVPDAYNPRSWARLRALKRRLDPANLLSINANVPPE